MDALKRAIAIFLIAIAILVPSCLADYNDAAGDLDGVLLYEVNPYNCEGVSIHNYGSSTVNLSNYAITDNPKLSSNEGSITFDDSITIAPGETLILASKHSKGDSFSDRDGVLIYSTGKTVNGITATSNFKLNDSGDDVYLFVNGVIIDAFFYGSIDTNDSYWSGEPCKITGKRWVTRLGTSDTDSASDWGIPGMTRLPFEPDVGFDATVTPFLFPESGGIPVYEAIENAEKSIRIEIYLLVNQNMLALLAQKASEGLDVDILLEGNPLGYNPVPNKDPIANLLNAGAEIRLIGADGGDRFSYVHAKYAVIDGSSVILTSENWTTENLNGSYDENPYDSGTKGNRGWGAIVESVPYAQYMDSIFENDWSKDYGDVVDITDKYKNLGSGNPNLKYSGHGTHNFPSYSAKVVPVMSNDNSWIAMEYYMNNASERIFSEQQSFGTEYKTLKEGTPVAIMNNAALRGVDARVIFATNDSVNDINTQTLVKAATLSAPYVHNKGLICDDVAWVSSVNWTENSFFNNRESAVAIQSKDIADFFASAFLKDFDRCYKGDGIRTDVTSIKDTYAPGKETTFQITVEPAGSYTYVWDFGDGTPTQTTTVGKTVHTPVEGTHTLTVTITDSEGTMVQRTITYTVSSDVASDDEIQMEDSMLYGILVLILIIVFAIISAFSKKGKGSKKTSKKKSSKKKR